MTAFFLSRHGETEWHAENRYAGRSDVALTARGLTQADQLARWAGGAGLTSVWSSTLSRAEITARKSAEAAGLPLSTDARFCEVDFGDGEGLTSADMRQRFPAALEAFHRDPVAHHLPGGEDPVRAAARFIEAMGEIASSSPDARILVVAHSTVLRLVVCTYLGIKVSRYRQVFPMVKNCSITELRLGPRSAALIAYNAETIPQDLADSPH